MSAPFFTYSEKFSLKDGNDLFFHVFDTKPPAIPHGFKRTAVGVHWAIDEKVSKPEESPCLAGSAP